MLKWLFGEKVDKTRPTFEEYILECPWKSDLFIARSSHIGTGEFSSTKGKAYHSVSCAADGPNDDETFHHAHIGWWPDFDGFEQANSFAASLQKTIKELVGVDAPIYENHKQKNEHAGWCMGCDGYTKPDGTPADELSEEFEVYDDEEEVV